MQRASRTPIAFDLPLAPLDLEFGGLIEHHVVRGWMWSSQEDADALASIAVDAAPTQLIRRTEDDLRAVPALQDGAGLRDDRKTVLIIHALTGDSFAGGPGGWWSGVIGRGRAFDPNQYRLLCFNNLGSCYGTSGPGDFGFPMLPGTDDVPRPITTWDQARSILAALDALGVEQVELVAGGSLGGMITLCLAAMAPQRFRRVMPIAANEAASPWIIGWNHIARNLILDDPRYPGDKLQGVIAARALAMMTYRAEPGMQVRHGRRRSTVSQKTEREKAGCRYVLDEPYAVQTYLDYQGEKLELRFDARAYISQLDAMDHHDISRRPPWAPPPENEREDTEDAAEYYPHDASRSWGLMRIQAAILAVGIDTDALYLPHHMRRLARRAESLGKFSEYREIESPHGHDAFLLEADQVNQILKDGLALALVDE